MENVGIFHWHLVNFAILVYFMATCVVFLWQFWYFFSSWFVLSRKMWQPCCISVICSTNYADISPMKNGQWLSDYGKANFIHEIYFVVNFHRGPFLTSPLGANFDPQWWFLPPGGELIPWGVKFSVCPSILLKRRKSSPLGVNEGVNIPPRGQSSPLGLKLRMALRTFYSDVCHSLY
jgi:hypothetical protein